MSKNKNKAKRKDIYLAKFNFFYDKKISELNGTSEVSSDILGGIGDELTYSIRVITSEGKEIVYVTYSKNFTFDEYLEKNKIKYKLNNSNPLEKPFLTTSHNEIIIFTHEELNHFKNKYEKLIIDQYVNVADISSYVFYPIEEINNKVQCYNKPTCKKIIDISTSTILGLGTGFAMNPIFNNSIKELEKYGVNIHSKDVLFGISTVNTLVVYSIINAINLCSFIQEYRNVENHNQNSLVKKVSLLTSSIISTTLPISLLWKTELENQKVTGEKDFNKFVAWATFTTLPLFICNVIESYNLLSKTIENSKTNFIELDSLGAKICTYGISLLSFIGRSVAYSSLNKFIFKEIGIKDDVAEGMSIVIGGIILNAIKGFSEFHSLQSLFEKTISKPTNIEIIKGILSTVEASWFSLPITAIGLNSCEDMNTFLKSAIFTPLFISTIVSEANNTYETFKFNHDGRDNYWGNDNLNIPGIDLVGQDQVEILE